MKDNGNNVSGKKDCTKEKKVKVKKIVEEENLMKDNGNNVSGKKDCTKEKKVKVKKIVVKSGTDENDNFEVHCAAGKNDDTDSAKIIDGHVVDCINKRVADQIVELMNSKIKDPFPEENVKRRKNKRSRKNNDLVGNGSEANNDNLEKGKDAAVASSGK